MALPGPAVHPLVCPVHALSRQMLVPLGLADIRIETFATSYDYLPGKGLPFSLFNAALGVLIAVSGNRLGFWHGITARKQ
jgi:hypothetical protein